MPSLNKSVFRRRVLLSGGIAVLLLLGLLWVHSQRPTSESLAQESASVEKPTLPREISSAKASAVYAQAETGERSVVAEALQSLSRLHGQTQASVDEKRAVLNQLFRGLDRVSDLERRTLLRAFFTSGEDARTDLPFQIGVGGWLSSSTSLRVALLDYIGRVDPALAAELRGYIYAGSRSSEEWAVCLRDEARVSRSPEARSLLESHLSLYLRDSAWTGQPSEAYLEGFDVVVFLRHTAAIPLLASLASNSSPQATRLAAFLSLDRLMLAAPGETLELLSSSPVILSGEPNVRAGLYARADLADARQQVFLEAYLARNDISDTERGYFGELFPNYNTTSSVNFLSSNRSYTLAEMRAGDQLALAQVERWLASSSYPAWMPALRRIQTRLKSFRSATPTGP